MDQVIEYDLRRRFPFIGYLITEPGEWVYDYLDWFGLQSHVYFKDLPTTFQDKYGNSVRDYLGVLSDSPLQLF